MLSSAARPLAKARPCAASSSDATCASSAERVGLPEREYSKPLWPPTPSWANVVDNEIGVTTAPVVGSGSWPAWIARVEKPCRAVTSSRSPITVNGTGAAFERSLRHRSEVGEHVGAGEHAERTAARQHQQGGCCLEHLDREFDLLADTDRRELRSHHLFDRGRHHTRVAVDCFHQFEFVDRTGHLGSGERRRVLAHR